MDKPFTPKELAFLKSLRTPEKVQEFIESLTYNNGARVSVAHVLRERIGDCLEAAAFGVFVLTLNGYEAFLMDLRSIRDDDHVLCVFKQDGCYGALAQSKFLGLRNRHPVYASLRELAMSYFHSYFNFFGEYSLREHSMPYHPEKLGEKWILDVSAIYRIEEEIDGIEHVALVPQELRLPRTSKLHFHREIVHLPEGTRIGNRYR
jgi:hypothetical protein